MVAVSWGRFLCETVGVVHEVRYKKSWNLVIVAIVMKWCFDVYVLGTILSDSGGTLVVK